VDKKVDYNITFRKKDKGWQFIISYKEDGKWKQKSKQGFKTQKEAKPAADKMLTELKKQLNNKKEILNSDYDTLKFTQLFDYFIDHSILYKEYNTIKGYKNAFAGFKILKDMPVKEIKKLDITKCVDGMVEKKLKYETIRTNLRRIKLAFEYYIENYDPNYINPINNIKLAKDKTESNKKALTKEQLTKLFEELKNNKFYIVAYIAGNCGLRCSEILGLTWNDINKIDMTLSVNKQWKVLKNGKSGFGPLKTKNSNRKVPITKNILHELEKYDKANPRNIANRIAPFNKASIEKYLNPELRKLAGISIHELRHTYATLLISNGVDFKTAASILGHTVEMTLRIYSHVTEDMLKSASKKIEKIF
jgi:integrase